MTPFPDQTAAAKAASKEVALALLDAGCVQVRSDEPFRLPSGWASPVYMDCRRLTSFPEIRRRLVQQGLALLRERQVLDGLGAVVGAESSGIALAAWLADALALPMHYVRKQTRGLGPGNQVVGVLDPGAPVLLVDDLMAGGHSKLNFCRALKAAGVEVSHLFVIFDYATFPTSSLLEPLGLTVHSLATWQHILEAARESAALPAHEIAELETFLHDPVRWSHAHGGISSVNPLL